MKILLPVDGSENSLRAADYLVKMAKTDPTHQVTLLTVAYFVDPMMLYDSPVNLEKIKAAAIEAHRKVANKAKAVFEQAGVPVQVEVISGDPAQTIIDYAEQSGIDKIVMGSRGVSNIKGILFGSVANKVLQLAKIPVTTVK